MSLLTFEKSKQYANKKYKENEEGIHSGKLNYMFFGDFQRSTQENTTDREVVNTFFSYFCPSNHFNEKRMQGKKFISPGAWFSMNYPSDWNEFEDGEGSFLFL